MGGWDLSMQSWEVHGGLAVCLGRRRAALLQGSWLASALPDPAGVSYCVLGYLTSLFPWPSHSQAPPTSSVPLAWGPGPSSGFLSVQVLGLVRVPLYTQKDRVGGFPNFLSNAFISTAKYQLLFALKVLNMMPEEKLAEAVAAATEKQKKALEKLLPSSS